jgi:membrane protease YdiL (CAAX protease family)
VHDKFLTRTGGLPSKSVLIFYFLALFLGAMVLGPLLYFGVGLVIPLPFHRAMDRAILISAVAALVLFRSRLPLRKLWPLNRDVWKPLLLGYGIAAVSIQTMIGANLALSGFTSAHLSGGEAAERVLIATIAAILGPLLEETVFRGFIQRELVSCLRPPAGLVVASAIFMLAHFIKVPVELNAQPVHLWSGPSALGAAFLPVLQGAFLCGRGLNLFLIGLILGGIFLRSGSLWMNAGLHSGWILGLLLFSGFTRPVEPPYVSYFGGDILSSLSTTLVLVLLALWIWRFYRHPSDSPGNGENAP